MYISGEGARVQAQRLEVIANNLANVETPGFKRDVPMFQSRFAEAIQDGTDYPGSGSQNDVGGGVKMISTETDFSRGGIRQTDTPTDFAINGEGFFNVRGGDGQVYLTRAGNFSLDANGRLQTQTNLPVLDEGGAEIVIDGTRPWSLDSGGRITQEGDSKLLGMTEPQSLGDLVKVGSNLFRSLGPTTPVAGRDVRQGYLEQSGVNPTREMMAMIETSRAFEANTKIIQHQDSMISGLLSRVLSNS
ncbi:Flagellar basal-body rod protein FlgG [Adhaeretor mobilis]|uniref:Flagellar basal-body rod protein FlgG n=2 Tax=Adhaeretor mobilis TaxID=1930276 RepID=A0A517MTU9_9BACT|nr:Flagellar basal-body rod protein FlgG [Adhaeretor mobilis]